MSKDDEFFAEFQRAIEEHLASLNSRPNAEIDNLSPKDMHAILYNTFGEDSPIGYRQEIKEDVLDNVPFLVLIEALLAEIKSAKEVKLTGTGSLPRKLCLSLYAREILKEEAIETGIVKLAKEGDSLVLQSMKYVALLSGVIKKRSNKISLTKKGQALLDKSKRYELLKLLFQSHFQKFNFGYFDGYSDETSLQSLFGYTMYLLLKYGDEEREAGFYATKNMEAFPYELVHFQGRWSTPEEQFTSCYRVRIFERFLSFYAFVDYKVENRYRPNKTFEVQTTPVFRELFEIRKDKFQFNRSKYTA